MNLLIALPRSILVALILSYVALVFYVIILSFNAWKSEKINLSQLIMLCLLSILLPVAGVWGSWVFLTKERY